MSHKKIEIRYFANIRELIGKAEETYETSADTVAALRCELAARDERYDNALKSGRVLRTAVNHMMVDEQTAFADGDEVAFFPPVTGG